MSSAHHDETEDVGEDSKNVYVRVNMGFFSSTPTHLEAEFKLDLKKDVVSIRVRGDCHNGCKLLLGEEWIHPSEYVTRLQSADKENSKQKYNTIYNYLYNDGNNISFKMDLYEPSEPQYLGNDIDFKLKYDPYLFVMKALIQQACKTRFDCKEDESLENCKKNMRDPKTGTLLTKLQKTVLDICVKKNDFTNDDLKAIRRLNKEELSGLILELQKIKEREHIDGGGRDVFARRQYNAKLRKYRQSHRAYHEALRLNLS